MPWIRSREERYAQNAWSIFPWEATSRRRLRIVRRLIDVRLRFPRFGHARAQPLPELGGLAAILPAPREVHELVRIREEIVHLVLHVPIVRRRPGRLIRRRGRHGVFPAIRPQRASHHRLADLDEDLVPP